MTRKDFELIASALRYCESHAHQGAVDTRDAETVEWVASVLADYLARTNPGFVYDRFVRAALPLAWKASTL